MRLVWGVLVMLTALVLCAAAQPTVNAKGIVNGASFAPVGLPNGNVAQGSMFSIFGTNLGPATSPGLSWPLQRVLGDVRVHALPAGATSPIDAILLYVGPNQVNAVLPSAVAVGQATLTVEYPAGQVSGAVTFNVVASSPGLFAKNSAGNGPVWLQNYVSGSNTPINALTQSAQQGQAVILWGTGIGAVSFDETQPPQVVDLTAANHVQVFVGGKGPITPFYAGRSAFAGEDQVNFFLPDDVPEGCYVPVTVMANGVASNSASLSVVAKNAASLTCIDEVIPLPADLTKDYRQGAVSLSHTDLSMLALSLKSESASGVFDKWAAGDIAKLHGNFGVSTFGACSVYTIFNTSSWDYESSFEEAAVPTPLDAGPQLNLKLPDNSTTVLGRGTLSYERSFNTQNAVLTPGTYTVDNGTGGQDVGPFTASLNVPEILVWANKAGVPTTINRSVGQLVTWTGGDQQTPDTVIILGRSFLADGTTGAGFFCLAKASDGQFTVPAEVLSRLPATDNVSRLNGVIGLAEFSAMSKSKIGNVPQGLDTLSFTYEFTSMKSVAYQ